jgi:hypothetical protein
MIERRPFWQFHLSSAVIMTVLAGVVVAFNFRPEKVTSVETDPETIKGAIEKTDSIENVVDTKINFYGFPFRGRLVVQALALGGNITEQTTFLVRNFVMNIVVGILLVGFGGFLSELVIRRARRVRE